MENFLPVTKSSLKKGTMVLAFLVVFSGCMLAEAADVELLKPWQPAGFKLMILDPWILGMQNNALGTLSATNSAGKSNAIVVNVVAASQDGEAWHVNLAQGGLKFKKGKLYRLTFSIKGSKVTGLNVGLNQNHEPWGSLVGGDAQSVVVNTDWQECSYTFKIGVDDANGSVVFSNFNTTGATFSLADVSLKEIDTPAK